MRKQLLLKKHEDKRIRSGHLWVFSNEVKEVRGDPQAGDILELRDHAGKFLGKGFYHPKSLIALRLLTQDDEDIDFQFFERRIHLALQMRKKFYPSSGTFRLVHGESDFLPGLVVDRYEEYISIQTFSLGMEMRTTLICDVLEPLLHPKGIVERNESPLRELEGMESRKGVLRGTISLVTITESDVKFEIDLLEGQKTGFFLDQRENRLHVRQLAKDRRVLDCFCNDGGFALHAARAGASKVLGIDVSASAVRRARNNAAINELGPHCTFAEGDAFEFLIQAAADGETYDLIILDPPSFTKSRKNIASAKRGYKEINANALRLLSPGGILATASCSHHITRDDFAAVIASSAAEARRKVQLIDWRGAAPDHPVLPAMPETEYLKFALCHVQ